MVKKLIFLVFIFQFSTLLSQERSLKISLISTQKIDADIFVGYDGLKYLYYIKDNILFKGNKSESWQYKNISLGNISRVDITNPLKNVLFYENFNTIILLDNQLNETQKINFSENEEPLIVTAIGIASQNRVWIYNSLTQKIGLFDYLKNTYQPISTSIQGDLKWYHSDFNIFQWIDEELNWYSCDLFGKIILIGKVPDFDQIQITEDKAVVFSKDKKLYLHDFQKDISYTIDLVEKSFENFYYKDQILSIFTPQQITNFKISKQ
jgi:hypothetical protein